MTDAGLPSPTGGIGYWEGWALTLFGLGWVVAAVAMVSHLALYLLGLTTTQGPFWWVATVALIVGNLGAALAGWFKR